MKFLIDYLNSLSPLMIPAIGMLTVYFWLLAIGKYGRFPEDETSWQLDNITILRPQRVWTKACRWEVHRKDWFSIVNAYAIMAVGLLAAYALNGVLVWN